MRNICFLSRKSEHFTYLWIFEMGPCYVAEATLKLVVMPPVSARLPIAGTEVHTTHLAILEWNVSAFLLVNYFYYYLKSANKYKNTWILPLLQDLQSVDIKISYAKKFIQKHKDSYNKY